MIILTAIDHTFVQGLRTVALANNWALGVHGTSLSSPYSRTSYRDIDLIGVPWTEDAISGLELVLLLMKTSGSTLGNYVEKAGGRYAYILLRTGSVCLNPDEPKLNWTFRPAQIDLSLVDARA